MTGTAPRFAKDRATIIFIGTALNARFLKQIPQLSGFRNVQLQHQDTCPLKVATKLFLHYRGPQAIRNEQDDNIRKF
jgi:hypothetical protein